MAPPVDLPSGLIYVSDDTPGYRRRRHGRGFAYLDPAGDYVRDTALKARFNALAIPPDYDDVWICPKPNGHLQATGRDRKQRKQYRYHPDWVAYRQASKFDRLLEFGECLPTLRERVNADLERTGWPREKVLALIVSLLDTAFMRIGNSDYQERNGTVGLTTLRRKHLDLIQGGFRFSYKGKSGQYREVEIRDSQLKKLVAETAELPGYELFRYREDGAFHGVDSGDVNEYLQRVTGQPFTSKNFRTWGGCVLAVSEWEAARADIADQPRKSFRRALVKRVAEKLGNTISVCETYYIHPDLLDRLEELPSLEPLREGLTQRYPKLAGAFDEEELLMWRLLRAENDASGEY